MLSTLFSPYAVGVLSRIAAQLIAFGAVMIASRYLDLASFGSFVLAWTVKVVFTALVYTGFYQAQLRSTEPDQDSSSYFWLMGAVALAGTLVMAGIGLLAGGAVTQTGAAFLLLAPLVLLEVPPAWNQAHLVSGQRIRAASLYTLPAQLATLAATWVALEAGWGLLALVAGNYVGVLVAVALTTALVRRVPRPELRRQALRDSRRTVPNLWGTSLLGMFSNYGADLILGAFLTTAAVGAYRGGSRIGQTVSDFVLQPLSMLSWSRFTRLEKDSDLPAMRAAWTDNMGIAAAMLWPMMISLAILADSIVVVIFEETWLPAAGVVAILAWSRAIRLVSALLEPTLICTGHNAWQIRIRLAGAVALLAGLLGFGRLSAELAAWAHFASGLVVVVPTIWATRRALDLGTGAMARAFLPGAILALGCGGLVWLTAPLRAALGTAPGLFATIGVIALFWCAAMALCLRARWLRLPQT